MKLLTKELEKRFQKVGRQDEKGMDAIVIAKFFNPGGAGTWFALSYDPKARIFFGYVSIFGDACDEFGDFSLEELESVKGQLGLGIERDLYFKEKPLKECLEN